MTPPEQPPAQKSAREVARPAAVSVDTVALSSRIKVALLHNDPLISAGLAVTLRERRNFEAYVFSPVFTSATLRSIRSADIVVADYDTGLRLLASAQAQNSKIVLLTHFHSEAQIYRAMEQGAHGYLLQGCSLAELIEGLQCVHAGVKALAPLAASCIADRIQQRALSKRELAILQQLMLGLSNKAIAHRLTVALGTVKTHVKSILSKLEASSRTEAAAIARRRGILPEESEPPHSKLNEALREPLADVRFEPQLGLLSAGSVTR